MVRDIVACVNFKEDMSWGYIEGYRRAAQLVRDRVLLEQRDLDLLIYPLGYLYRHHIELQLKWLITRAKQLRQVNTVAALTHSVSALWQQLKDELLDIAPHETQFDEELHELIEELISYDNSAQNFRYDTNRDGSNSLANITHVNVSDFCARMDTISEHLDALHWRLSEDNFSLLIQ